MDLSAPDAVGLKSLHDAELDLISIDRLGRRLSLRFLGVDTTITTVSFEGVLTHRLDSVLPQNVVSRCLVSNAPTGFGGNLEGVARWTSSVTEGGLLIKEDHFQSVLTRIRSGELILFYLEPSWGAEGGVIAESMHVAQEARA